MIQYNFGIGNWEMNMYRFDEGKHAGILMVKTTIYPHGFCFSCPRKAAFLVKCSCSIVCYKDVLVEISIFCDQAFHQLGSNSLSLVIGMNKQVRIIYDQMSVRDCIAQSDELVTFPGGP